VFDTSVGRAPIQFQLGAGQVIPGFEQGIVGMKVGGKRRLTIPPSLGYGSAGRPPTIPPNSTLVFDVDLVSIP
jgi:FKBP-type peptidyl-prolyl cis-trans isomerase